MKKLTFLFAFLCASVMGWATQYCGETLTATDGVTTVTITCTNPSTDTYVMQIVGGDNFSGFIGEGNYFELSGVGGNQVKNNTDEANRTCSFDDGTKTLTVTLTSNTTPKMYTPLYLNISGEKQFTTIQNQVFEWPTSCSGGSSTPEPAPGEKFVAANASIASTYFATGGGWAADAGSTASYDNGVISVHIDQVKSAQWQGQVKMNLGFVYSADKYYDFSIKFHASKAVGGVTLKTSNDNALFYENQSVNLPADADYVYTKSDVAGVLGDNTFVFDFGWAAAGTDITISEISIIEHDAPATPVDPNAYTASGHTIHLDASYVDDIYTLVITSTDDMDGLGGSFWNVSGVGTDMRSNSGTNSYTVSTDKKTITCQVKSNSAPNIYTPLYVLMPGEVNFGNVTLNWEDRTPINSEYCNYQGSETQQDGHYFAITFETDPSGNVVVTIGDGTGAGACSFRNGAFEGNNNGLVNFVVSDDDFATTTPATDYFTVTRPADGDLEYVMTKIADLPANAKIKHLSAGAIAWRESGTDRWCFPEFIYTYGGICNQLDAPTNVGVAADSTITFDAVTGADKYTAYVSLSGVEKYHQEVASGDKLHFIPYVDGDYDVTVVASGAGKVDSDPSTAFVWSLTAVQIVLGNSEYCEHVMMPGDNREAAITWETDDSGNIVITISATQGNAADTHFRGNGISLNKFTVGAGKSPASNYFNHACGGSNQVTLTLKDPAVAPALGEKIYVENKEVEYATTSNTNAYPALSFEYTYGTVCSGKAVSATSNNNTMGTAVVKKGNDVVTSVDENDEVSFIATVTDAELYRFVNWTKGGVEVSTNATYVTTITESTNLIANFDYIRNTYCHAEINSIQNKKLYMTLGAIGGGQYQIKFEGSAEAKLTSLTNANYTVNWVTTTIADGDKKMSGQDVPFNNARWAFSADGYGSATMTFGISEGKTWEDIYVWNHAIYFMTAEGEVGYTGFPDRNHIDWNSTCEDEIDPVLVKYEGAVLDANSVRLTIQATDNWEGLLTYTISRAGAEDIVLYGASGEELTQDITGLTTGTEYTFTVVVSDGVNNDVKPIVVTPVGDETKPVMGEASLESKTWNSAIINVAATDNVGVASFHIDELNADYVASAGKISIEGLTQGTAYTFTIKAKDAAGNISDNSAVVNFSTDAHLLAPATVAPAPTWPEAQVISFYSDAYTAPNTWNFRAPWGGTTAYEQVEIASNHVIHYSALDYVGWIYTVGSPYNAINMEKLHLDIWVENDCEIGIVPIYGGTNLTTDDNKRTKPALIGQQWNSVDLDLATDYAGLNLTSIFQFKFDQATTSEFYLDNVYFYRTTELVDYEAPANVTADVVSQSYFSVTLEVAATDNMGGITYIVKNGEAQVASNAGASGSTVTIKVENLTPGTAYNLSVVAKDGSDNTADAIQVAANTLAAPAAAPVQTVEAANVKALYSDVYTPVVAVENYCEWWWEAPTVHTNYTLGEGDHVLFYDNNHQAGASFGWAWNVANKVDFTGYQKLHLSICPTNAGTIEVYPVVANVTTNKVSQQLVANQWNEIVLDFTDKTFAPLNQVGFINFYDLGEFFVDNVYFFREPNYTRDVTEGRYGTICLPNGGEIVGCALYEVAYFDASAKKIFFDEVLNGAMVAGTPYIFLPEENVTQLKVYYTDAANATAGNANGLVGSYTKELLEQNGDNYIFYNNQYLEVNSDNVYVGENRAYIKKSQLPTQAVTPAPGRRRIAIGAAAPQVVTGIDGLNVGDQPVKVLIDGQLYILRGEKMYNINGQIVK